MAPMPALRAAPIFDVAAGAVEPVASEPVSMPKPSLQVKAQFPDLSAPAPERSGDLEAVSLTNLGFGVAQGISGDPGHFFDPKGDRPNLMKFFDIARNAGNENDLNFLRSLE